MFRNKFLISLLSATLYELLMTILRPDGFSVTKLVITLLAWNALAFSLFYLITAYEHIRQQMPHYAFWVFITFIVWNSVSVLRSTLGHFDSITTLFGNPYTTLALFVPLVLSFGLNKANLRTIHRCLLCLTAISIVFTVSALCGFPLIDTGLPDRSLPTLFLYIVSFLIITVSFESIKHKIVVLLGSILCLLYTGIIGGSRGTVLRMVMSYLSLLALYIFKKFNFRLIPAIAIVIFFVPVYFVYTSAYTNQSIFQTGETYLKQMLDLSARPSILEKTDSRTFLYTEVFDDLVENDSLMVGKGSNGTYFSLLFFKRGGDSDTRSTVEVGLLAILLKGGIIAVVLNLTLLFLAIYLAFYRSRNHYVMGIGFMLLVHTLVFFVENLVSFSLYNYAVWFFVGVCFSDELRKMDDTQIKAILNTSSLK